MSPMQRYLALNPHAGDVIQGTGGLRKARWAAEGGGKRGGVRVICFHVSGVRIEDIYGRLPAVKRS